MRIRQGWLEGARKVLSPNFNPRPAGSSIDTLVIHNISLPPEQFGGNFIEQFFTNSLSWDQHPYFETIKGLEVSSHILITRDGGIIQFVSFDDRAWHAGQSRFCGRENCNDFSIGIELEGTDTLPFEKIQYDALSAVTRLLLAEYPALAPSRIVGHSDIAPGRKTDPGPAFDWQYFFDQIQ